jgi:hypothetical protein
MAAHSTSNIGDDSNSLKEINLVADQNIFISENVNAYTINFIDLNSSLIFAGKNPEIKGNIEGNATLRLG